MPEVTLRFDELESGNLPPVCMQCGSKHEVDLVSRTFVWRPIFVPPLLAMVMTKRIAADIPLCQAHGGYRMFGYQRSAWWGLRTVAVSGDRITIGGVHDDFVDALYRRRERRDYGDRDDEPRPRRRVQVGRGPGGGMTAFKVLGIIVAVMVALTVLMTCGMFGVMGVMMLWMPPLPRAGPPPVPTPGPPVAIVEPRPEGVVVGLLGAAPTAGGPAGLPWGPLALSGRKETFHLLDDAELTKALIDLRSRFPHEIEAAAKSLAEARPTEARRKETAAVLQTALANPFPTVKEAAAEALAVWGSGDDVPTLIPMLKDFRPDAREAAMTALAGLKDERGAAAIAERLPDVFDREKARTALEKMGPVAEKAVAPLLTHADPQTRLEACAVLKAIGTKDSVQSLEAAARDPDMRVAQSAADALQAVQKRP